MRKAIQGSMVLAVLLGAFAEADPIQWPTADGGNGHYYEAISYPAGITWGDAESYAARCVYSGLEGHLATITSAAENRFIANELGASIDHYWVGGYQPPGSPEPDGGWTWITGEPWGYTNWAGGEANNSYGGDGIIPRPDLKYLHEEALQFKNNYGWWNDMEEYSGWGGFIVEYESPIVTVTSPTVSTLPLGDGDVGLTSATLRGKIDDDGGEACEYRFRYRKEGDSSYTEWSGDNDTKTTGQTFTEEITGLDQGTTYYFIADAKNSVGTSSGQELSFTTPSVIEGYVIEGYVHDWLGNPMKSVKIQVFRIGGAILWAGETNKDGEYISDPIPNPSSGTAVDLITASLENSIVEVRKVNIIDEVMSRTKELVCSSESSCEIDFVFGSEGMNLQGPATQERACTRAYQEILLAHGYFEDEEKYKCDDIPKATVVVLDYANDPTVPAGIFDPVSGTIRYDTRVAGGKSVIWHEYGHFVHWSELGRIKYFLFGLNPSAYAIVEGWAMYVEEYNSNPNPSDSNRSYVDFDNYAYDWGYVYASIFNDIADGVSLSEWDLIDGERSHLDKEDGTQDKGHQMIWKILMEDEVSNILSFHDRLAARYPEIRWGLALIFRIHNIPGYDGYYPPLQLSRRIDPGHSQTAEAILNTHVATGLFHLQWPGSDLDLMLVSPSGLTIDPTYAQQDANIVFVEGPTEEYYVVEQPEAGEWQMHVTAVDVPPEGEDYTVTVSLTTHLMLILTCDKETYTPGEPVSLRAELLYDANSYSDANVVAQVQTPLGTETVPLFDDGLHNDGGIGDGIYANTYTDTLTAGDYQITATASGRNPFGEPFVRETGKTILVQDLPDLALYDLTINQGAIEDPAVVAVRVLNEGTRDANGVFVTFYDVNDTEPIQIGEDIGIDYLAPGESQDVSIVWDAPAGAHDLYVVVDYLNTVPESDEANNYLTRRFCAEWKIFGDLNQDCIINFLDLALLGNQWLASCSGPDWCEAADLDQNGRVGASDLSLLAHNWLHGQENPPIVISPIAH